MAFQQAAILLASTPDWGAAGTSTANAAGESLGIVGQVRIANNATSKVLSAAGNGKILWQNTSATFATGGTTFRVGIQDVDLSTGLEDGTFDVYKEYVQGTDTITSNAYNVATMSSGTKTLSDGDLIAIVAEMPVRNGADSVTISSSGTGIVTNASNLGFPYGTVDTGALAKSNAGMLYALIQFDDGTVGWINGATPFRQATTTVAFNSGSTPDEYCGTFSVPYKMQISGISIQASGIATTDAFEVILYTDPYGAATATITVTPDQDVLGAASASNSMHLYRVTPTTISPNVTYGVSLRPTTVNSINLHYEDLVVSAAADIIRLALPFQNLKLASRTNQTGAFSVVSNNYLPVFVLDVCGLDDGTGVGGGYLPVV